jgi:hypothetical protein
VRTFADCTDATASGDTTETLVGTITLSAKAKRIVGVWCSMIGGAVLTHSENVSGIIRLDSPDFSISPFKFPTPQLASITSGMTSYEPRIIPVNIPATGSGKVTAYVTNDMALTGAHKTRVGLIYEGDE